MPRVPATRTKPHSNRDDVLSSPDEIRKLTGRLSGKTINTVLFIVAIVNIQCAAIVAAETLGVRVTNVTSDGELYPYRSADPSYDDSGADCDLIHAPTSHGSFKNEELDIERIQKGSNRRMPSRLDSNKFVRPLIDRDSSGSSRTGLLKPSPIIAVRSGRPGPFIGDGHVDLSPLISSDNFFSGSGGGDHFALDGTMVTSHKGPNDNSMSHKALLNSILPPLAPPSSGFLRSSTNNIINANSQIIQNSAPKVLSIFSNGPSVRSSMIKTFRLDQYHTLDEIYSFMDQLSNRYPHVRVFSIGTTSEGRPLKAIEIMNNNTDPDYIWLDALTHAREWITGSTILYIIDQVASGKSTRNKNFLIIPVVNPDGYSYTWTNDRMWRKNRSKQIGLRPNRAGQPCYGADLNRNYDLNFGGEGSSNNPCSHIFSGPFPFSEQETKSVSDLLWSLKDRIKFYLTLHSYNQLWACPYAYTTEPSPGLDTHMRVLRAVQKAVFDTDGVKYDIGPLSTSLYVGSGFGIDFAYDKCGIEHSYLVELRDRGQSGFILAPDQIMPTARETWNGLLAAINIIF